jgi:hypothetical protein
MALVHGEEGDDFEAIFRSLESDDYRPRYLIADCADAISNGFSRVFGEPIRVHCWAHVIRSVDKRLKSYKRDWVTQIRQDIVAMQLCKSEEEFSLASKLFTRKWEKIHMAEEFLEYFNAEYLLRFNGWFKGRAPGHPSTNNGLESTNRIIKDEATLRERLALGLFFERTFDILKYWSKLRDDSHLNFKQFAMEPTIDTKLFNDAYQWNMSEFSRNAKFRKQDESTTF